MGGKPRKYAYLGKDVECETLWALRGTAPQYYSLGPDDEIVALFTSEKAARKYAQDAKLKSAPRWPSYGDRVFRASSVLGRYQGYYIEVYDPEDLPLEIDPELE